MKALQLDDPLNFNMVSKVLPQVHNLNYGTHSLPALSQVIYSVWIFCIAHACIHLAGNANPMLMYAGDMLSLYGTFCRSALTEDTVSGIYGWTSNFGHTLIWSDTVNINIHDQEYFHPSKQLRINVKWPCSNGLVFHPVISKIKIKLKKIRNAFIRLTAVPTWKNSARRVLPQ